MTGEFRPDCENRHVAGYCEMTHIKCSQEACPKEHTAEEQLLHFLKAQGGVEGWTWLWNAVISAKRPSRGKNKGKFILEIVLPDDLMINDEYIPRPEEMRANPLLVFVTNPHCKEGRDEKSDAEDTDAG